MGQGRVCAQFHLDGLSRNCSKADAKTKAHLGVETIITVRRSR